MAEAVPLAGCVGTALSWKILGYQVPNTKRLEIHLVGRHGRWKRHAFESLPSFCSIRTTTSCSSDAARWTSVTRSKATLLRGHGHPSPASWSSIFATSKAQPQD